MCGKSKLVKERKNKLNVLATLLHCEIMSCCFTKTTRTNTSLHHSIVLNVLSKLYQMATITDYSNIFQSYSWGSYSQGGHFRLTSCVGNLTNCCNLTVSWFISHRKNNGSVTKCPSRFLLSILLSPSTLLFSSWSIILCHSPFNIDL